MPIATMLATTGAPTIKTIFPPATEARAKCRTSSQSSSAVSSHFVAVDAKRPLVVCRSSSARNRRHSARADAACLHCATSFCATESLIPCEILAAVNVVRPTLLVVVVVAMLSALSKVRCNKLNPCILRSVSAQVKGSGQLFCRIPKKGNRPLICAYI